jgi:hypothetical protein
MRYANGAGTSGAFVGLLRTLLRGIDILWELYNIF